MDGWIDALSLHLAPCTLLDLATYIYTHTFPAQNSLTQTMLTCTLRLRYARDTYTPITQAFGSSRDGADAVPQGPRDLRRSASFQGQVSRRSAGHADGARSQRRRGRGSHHQEEGSDLSELVRAEGRGEGGRGDATRGID